MFGGHPNYNGWGAFFMVTKTLGIKFQVAGVKEATAGLDNLRNNLNASLQQNKQAVRKSLRLGDRVNSIVPNGQLTGSFFKAAPCPPKDGNYELKVVSNLANDLAEWGDRFAK